MGLIMPIFTRNIFEVDARSLFVGALAFVVSMPVISAESGEVEKSPKRKNRLIEEVIVTAQKREENVSDVPVSIVAYSNELLDAKGVLSAQDLPLITPGLTLSTSVNFLTVFIRGIGSDAFLVADPSVASYVDGIYFPFSNGAVQDFGAVDRIEVLKGPQGTLFGRNAVGGAIHVITKSPNPNELEVSLQTMLNDHGTQSSRLHVSVPVIDENLAVSASLIYSHGDNYIDGTAGGETLQGDETKGARVKLFWSPAEWVEANLAFLKIEQRGVGSDYMPNAQPSALGRTLGIEAQDPYAGEVNEDIFFFHNNETIYGSLNFFLEPFDARVIAGTQDITSLSNYDFDGSPLPLVFFQIEPGAAEVDSLEFQLLSNQDSWGADWFKWIVGAYYFESTAGFPNGFARLASTDLDNGTLLGIEIPQSVSSLIDSLTGGLPIPDGRVDFIGLLKTESISYYTQMTFSITDWMDLTLAGRYQNDERYIIESSSGLRTSSGDTLPLLYNSGVDDPRWRDEHSSFKPKVSLEFRPPSGVLGEEPLVYITYQQAIKGSAYNVINLIDDPEFVKPEELDAFEIGLKTRFMDGAITLNAAAFYYDLTNPQVQFVSVLEGGVISFENAGSAEVKGFEIDSVVQILPNTIDNFVFTIASTFLDPIYTSYENGTGFDPTTGLLSSGAFDFTGNQIVRSPKFSGTVGLSKAFNFDTGQLEIAADYFHTSKIYFLAQNSEFSEQEAYGVVNVRASYIYDPWGLRLSVYGKNVADEEYSNALVLTDFGRLEARAPRSQYGVRVNWDF
jgi:iron complex outermembrane receptor protein